MPRKAIIIGAGPAGLTAAWELLKKTDIVPVIVEKDPEYVGGIARTVRYKGNRIDIGGHRFFSKSDRVMDWWLNIMPLDADAPKTFDISYQGKSRNMKMAEQPADKDEVMLVRNRKSRIYYRRMFFDYPVRLNGDTIKKLGWKKMAGIGLSYIKSSVTPVKEKNLEDFYINRFGKELYETFFRDYTEKVWGRKCSEISPEWGRQRVKGLSLRKALGNFMLSLFGKDEDSIRQKGKETSLIERFLYPKYGPGQLWEIVARQVQEMGGTLIKGHSCRKVIRQGDTITGIEVKNEQTGEVVLLEGDYFFSTMPVKDLVAALSPEADPEIAELAGALEYRDFFTVGLLVDELKIKENNPAGDQLIRDNWIYIQEPDVLMGRLQIFNNWSPHLVADQGKVWIGLEYFCKETDEIWRRPDAELIALGKKELEAIGIIEQNKVVDACVIRMPKTYPAYFGAYDRFDEIRQYVNRFENLFLIGRNGMHKYNNQDHSMLTAMQAVDNIIEGRTDKGNLWEINTEEEYHEEKK